jgi:peptidyl-Lys metalloendopeptidase
MSKNFNWLVGCFVAASLLSACGQPGQDAPAQASRETVVEDAHALRAGQQVTVTLAAPKASLGASEDVAVTVTLRNGTRHAVRLLKWQTPVEGLEEPLFQLKRGEEEVAFIGPHYKRPAAQEKDFLVLKAGESLTRTVSLSDLYDLSKSGTYSIRYGDSNELKLSIEGREARLPESPVESLTGAISYSGRCSTTQQATLLEAMNAGSAMADNSAAYLAGTPSGTPRYTTWFGAFSSSGWSTAQRNFVAIKDAFDTKPVTLDCSCKKSYYAYVYPTQPYKIYVCSAFWSAPMTGTDSKGGTLIHEMSHFNAVAGTDDHVYGQSGAKNLAATNPANALDNADNHEYFAENTPFLQ